MRGRLRTLGTAARFGRRRDERGRSKDRAGTRHRLAVLNAAQGAPLAALSPKGSPKWARQGSNLRPTDYESRAGTHRMRRKPAREANNQRNSRRSLEHDTGGYSIQTGTETGTRRKGLPKTRPSANASISRDAPQRAGARLRQGILVQPPATRGSPQCWRRRGRTGAGTVGCS